MVLNVSIIHMYHHIIHMCIIIMAKVEMGKVEVEYLCNTFPTSYFHTKFNKKIDFTYVHHSCYQYLIKYAHPCVGWLISHQTLIMIIYTIIILLKSVAVSRLQVAILARLSREMSQTVRIDWKHILSRVRISVRLEILLYVKNTQNYHEYRVAYATVY